MKTTEEIWKERINLCKHAIQFEIGASRINPPDTKPEEFVSAPSAANIAFCLELYLKLLLHIKDPSDWPEGHKLKTDLFDKLDPSHRAIIEKSYEDWKSKKPSRMSVFPSAGDLLKESDNAFVDWRYYYENPGWLIFRALTHSGSRPHRVGCNSP